MDRKKSPNRTKRQHKVVEDNYWDCSVCTYRNTAEAFKCLMCDTRKGTSTRKPRLNPQLAAAQQAVQPQYGGLAVSGTGTATATTGSIKREKSAKRRSSQDKDPSKRLRKGPPRLSNVDRSSAQTREITVNNVTVVITEYEPKRKKNDTVSSAASSETDTDTPRGRDSNATDSPSS
uniref:Putative ring1 interactor rybp n=1 Tax=Panstrongylus megistus TaxID=65343 RepID=A0A069DPR9_9HEMI